MRCRQWGGGGGRGRSFLFLPVYFAPILPLLLCTWAKIGFVPQTRTLLLTALCIPTASTACETVPLRDANAPLPTTLLVWSFGPIPPAASWPEHQRSEQNGPRHYPNIPYTTPNTKLTLIFLYISYLIRFPMPSRIFDVFLSLIQSKHFLKSQRCRKVFSGGKWKNLASLVFCLRSASKWSPLKRCHFVADLHRRRPINHSEEQRGI